MVSHCLQDQSESCMFPWYKLPVLFKFSQSCMQNLDMLEHFFSSTLKNFSKGGYW